jgi:hypothetical protein
MQKITFAQCKICEAPTFRSNYGVLTCSSCKIFFRRNATREQVICEIFFLLKLIFVFRKISDAILMEIVKSM